MAHPSAGSGVGRAQQRRVLWAALAINVAFVGVELAGGLSFHSLALLGDSAHQTTDVVALAVALIALQLMERPGSARHTFGLQRTEVLAALLNGCALGAVAIWVGYEGIRRLQHPRTVHGGPVLAVAFVGLVANAAGAVLVGRARGDSLGMRAVAAHLASDALALFATIVAAGVIVIAGTTRADGVASVFIAALVLRASWRLIVETVHVLLEGTPSRIDVAALERALLQRPDVAGVHHLHVWSLASDTTALSAHVVLEGALSLHDAQQRADDLKEVLAREFGIDHATLELECHDCEVPDETGRIRTWRS